MKKARVCLRDTNEIVEIKITSDSKPIIDDATLSKWQSITTILSRLMDARAGLINRIDSDYLEIFTTSINDKNPYKTGMCGKTGHGDYCEMVIGRKKRFMMADASKDEVWKNSPYIKYNFISYYGLPLVWPDGEVFGTLCVIDDKVNDFSDDFQSIFREFKLSIEKDLEILIHKHELSKVAELDVLTGVYNRRKLNDILKYEFARSKRYGNGLSVIVFDFDRFKFINDTYGHQVGDEVLVQFAKEMKDRIRETDFLFRLGGDEFILVCPNTTKILAQKLIFDINELVVRQLKSIVKEFDISYGIAEFEDDETYEKIIKRADDNLYKMKADKKNSRTM